jgi:hypothetical protein
MWPAARAKGRAGNRRSSSIDGAINVAVQYCLSSLSADVARIAWVARSHAGIENRVH